MKKNIIISYFFCVCLKFFYPSKEIYYYFRTILFCKDEKKRKEKKSNFYQKNIHFYCFLFLLGSFLFSGFTSTNNIIIIQTTRVDFAHDNLILQPGKILLRALEISLRRGEVLLQKHLGFGDGVLDHDVGAEPQMDRLLRRDLRLAEDEVRERVLGGCGLVGLVLLLQEVERLERLGDLGDLLVVRGEVLVELVLHELVLGVLLGEGAQDLVDGDTALLDEFLDVRDEFHARDSTRIFVIVREGVGGNVASHFLLKIMIFFLK
jgi:hypothetical protein